MIYQQHTLRLGVGSIAYLSLHCSKEMKMEELVALVVKKTGLDEKQAEQAVKVVLEFIKDKLPPAVASQIDNLIEGKGDLGSAAGMLGKMFG